MHRGLIRLTMAGALTGLAAGIVMEAFRWVIETTQRGFLPGGQLGNYEGLPAWAMLCLPLGGGLLLGLVFERLPPHLRSVGIVHVIQKLRYTGRPDLPAGNAVVQFFAGAFALVCGHSVGREGPAVHLGAATGSWLGRRSESEAYTLTVAGAAAAIAAAFNTPLAGIVFVIEVLGMRYRMDRFIPVMTASVIGAMVSRFVHGATPTFKLAADIDMASLGEVVLFGGLGLVTGLVAVAFIGLTTSVWERIGHLRPVLGFGLAGLVTGLIGLLAPQVPGISYDTLNQILHNHLGLSILAALVLGKLVATAIAIGLRVPGGLIGPSLVIGGALGGLVGVLVQSLPIPTANAPFYAAVGMVAMMSAVLQAPLAALIALLELTSNPQIIFPGMIAVVFADVVARQMLGRESIFEHIRRLAEGIPGEGGKQQADSERE